MGPYDDKTDELKDPFKITYKEFSKLDLRQRNFIFDRAYTLSRCYVQEYFRKNPKIDWIIIAQRKDSVIVEGYYNDEPGQGFLGQKAVELDSPIFPFARPRVIKQMPVRYI